MISTILLIVAAVCALLVLFGVPSKVNLNALATLLIAVALLLKVV